MRIMAFMSEGTEADKQTIVDNTLTLMTFLQPWLNGPARVEAAANVILYHYENGPPEAKKLIRNMIRLMLVEMEAS